MNAFTDTEHPFLARLRRLNATMVADGRKAEAQAKRRRRAPLKPIAKPAPQEANTGGVVLIITSPSASFVPPSKPRRAANLPRKMREKGYGSRDEHKPP
jgi:hypothetical protein